MKDYQNHQNRVLTQITDATKDLNPRDTVFLASEVSSDFESLLLQSRAALDRLTNFTSKHYGNDSPPIFSNIENTLKRKKTQTLILKPLIMQTGLNVSSLKTVYETTLEAWKNRSVVVSSSLIRLQIELEFHYSLR